MVPQKDYIERINPNCSFVIDNKIPDRILPESMFSTSLPPPVALCVDRKKMDFGTLGFAFT